MKSLVTTIAIVSALFTHSILANDKDRDTALDIVDSCAVSKMQQINTRPQFPCQERTAGSGSGTKYSGNKEAGY